MLKPASDFKDIDGGERIGSSLANIGLDPVKREYEAVSGKSTEKTKDSDLMLQCSMERSDENKPEDNDLLLDGDETPKVSRVSYKHFLSVGYRL